MSSVPPSKQTIRRRAGVLMALGLASLVLPALSREVWLAPLRYVLPTGAQLWIGRWAGDNFDGDQWPGRSRNIEQITHTSPSADLDLSKVARGGDTLSTTLSLTTPGTHVIGMKSYEIVASLDGFDFTEHLKAKGLDSVIALRALRKETDTPGREAYRRCAKTIVLVGAPAALPLAADTTWRHRIGHPLELIPERNPYRLLVGDSLVVRVLANGKPSAGTLVQIWEKAGGRTGNLRTRRADARGRIGFRISACTSVLLSAVQMRPHHNTAVADWRSTWASLTFGGPVK